MRPGAWRQRSRRRQLLSYQLGPDPLIPLHHGGKRIAAPLDFARDRIHQHSSLFVVEIDRHDGAYLLRWSRKIAYFGRPNSPVLHSRLTSIRAGRGPRVPANSPTSGTTEQRRPQHGPSMAQGVPADEIAAFGVGKLQLAVPTAQGVREPLNRGVVITERGPVCAQGPYGGGRTREAAAGGSLAHGMERRGDDDYQHYRGIDDLETYQAMPIGSPRRWRISSVWPEASRNRCRHLHGPDAPRPHRRGFSLRALLSAHSGCSSVSFALIRLSRSTFGDSGYWLDWISSVSRFADARRSSSSSVMVVMAPPKSERRYVASRSGGNECHAARRQDMLEQLAC